MELPAAAWQDLLVQAAALGVIRIRLTGGEPLLRKDFAELYTFTRRLGIRILLFTNARLIKPHLADLFVSIPPGEDIEVTAYGLSAGSYETFSRKRGSYAEYMRGLQLLLDRKIPFYIKGAR